LKSGKWKKGNNWVEERNGEKGLGGKIRRGKKGKMGQDWAEKGKARQKTEEEINKVFEGKFG
jgi:hypothetical protein